jgi:outer membrane protein assembly factor BamB
LGNQYLLSLKAKTLAAAALLLFFTWRAGAADQLSGGSIEESRATLWHVSGEGRGVPVVDGSTAYFLSKRHEVIAVDASSGAVRWRRSTGANGDATLGSTLVLAGKMVVAGDYDVYGFDRATGGLRWRFAPNDGYGAGIYLGGSEGGLVFSGSPSGRVYAIEPDAGDLRWSAAVALNERTTVFQPSVEQGMLAAGYTTFGSPNTGGVIVLDAATGHERWRAAFPHSENALDSAWAGGPLFCDGLLVVASSDGNIHAFDRASGSRRWSIQTRPSTSPNAEGAVAKLRDLLPIARSGKTIIAGSLTGDVSAYHLETHRELWRYSGGPNGSVAARITSDRDSVYVPYHSGWLVALDVRTGQERWRVGPNAKFSWAPAPLRDRLFVASSDAGFFAFRK